MQLDDIDEVFVVVVGGSESNKAKFKCSLPSPAPAEPLSFDKMTKAKIFLFSLIFPQKAISDLE
jgi:hypothetical protein